MTALKQIAIATVVAIFAQQPIITYKNEGGHVIIRNFSDVKTDFPDKKTVAPKGENHVVITGELAIVEAPEKGFSATGQTIDLRWAQLDRKRTEIREALDRGHATVTMDSDWGYKSKVENAKENNQPNPEQPTESRSTKVDSEIISYTGTIDKGTLVFSVPWTCHQTNKGGTEQVDNGKKTMVAYDQSFDCDGTKGQMVIGPGKDGELNQLQTGYIDGPVHFKLIRHETPEGTNKTSLTSYIVVADHVDIDLLTAPGTVTATGHVKVDRDADGYQSNIVVDRFVLIVSQQMEPIGMRLGTGNGRIDPKGGSK